MAPQDRYTECLFCGRTDLTKEDIMPLWVSRRLRDAIGNTDFNVSTARGSWSPSLLNLQVRAFCGEHCNSGWMSGLETTTIPVLTNYMLAERPRLMSVESQEMLATWAYKTFLTFMAWHDADLIGRAEYRRFYEQRHPGPATLVSATAYAGTRWASRFNMKGRNIAGVGRIHDAPNNAVTAVFNIFRIVFVIFRWFGDSPLVGDTDFAENPLLRIWPPTVPMARWPIGDALTEDEYASFDLLIN